MAYQISIKTINLRMNNASFFKNVSMNDFYRFKKKQLNLNEL